MKKVEKVSIGRYAFSIEIDAYEAISKYLEDLRKFYEANPNISEILESIEERIAELFIEKKGDGVITKETVDQVIDIIGRPEMLDNEESETTSDSNSDKQHSMRKLHRNIEDKLLGGVCSGLAAYFQMDSTLMRIIWIAFLILGCIFETIFLGPILAYLICWAIIPPANTVEKRYAMKGESIGIDNISTNANTKSSQSDFWRIFGRAISIFMGGILILIGVSGLVSAGVVTASLTIAKGLDLGSSFTMIADSFSFMNGMSHFSKILLITLGTLSLILPFIAMIYAGIHLVFNLEGPKWRPGLVLFFVWIVAVVAFVTICSCRLLFNI